MLNKELLELLRCPEDRSRLLAASDEVIGRVNARIREGRLFNRAGKQLEQPLDGGLLRSDEAVLYPIIEQIPVLLPDDAIALEQLRD